MPAVKNPANTPSGKDAARATSTFWGCVLGFDKWSNYFNERGIIVPRGVILKWGDDAPPPIPPCICSSSSSLSVGSCGSDNSISSSGSSRSSSDYEESITISIGKPPPEPAPKDASKQRKGSQDVKDRKKSEQNLEKSKSKEELSRQGSVSKENVKRNGSRRNSKDSQLSNQQSAERTGKRESTAKANGKKNSIKEKGPSNQASTDNLNRSKSTSKENVKNGKKKKSAEEIQVHRIDRITNQTFPREALRSESPTYEKMRRASPNDFEAYRRYHMLGKEDGVSVYNERTDYYQNAFTPQRRPSPSYNPQRYETTNVSSRRRPSPVLPASQSVEMVVLNLDGSDYNKTTQVFNCEGAVVDPPPSRCPNAGPRQVSYQLPPTTSPARGCPNKTQGSTIADEPDQYPMVDPNTGNKYVLIKVASGNRKHPEDISVMLNEPSVGNEYQDAHDRRKRRRRKNTEEDSDEEEDSEVEDVDDETGSQKKRKGRRRKNSKEESDSDDDIEQRRTTGSKNRKQLDQGGNSLPIYITKRRVKKHRGDRDDSDDEDDEPRGGRRHHGGNKHKDEDSDMGENDDKRSRSKHDNHNGRSHQKRHQSHSKNERSKPEKLGPCGRCGRSDGKKQNETSGRGGAGRKAGAGKPCRCSHAACDKALKGSSKSAPGNGGAKAAAGEAEGDTEGSAVDSNEDNQSTSNESENGKKGKKKKGKNKKAKGDTEKNDKKSKKKNSKKKADKSNKGDSLPPSKTPSSDTQESSSESSRNDEGGGEAPADGKANQTQNNRPGKSGKGDGEKKPTTKTKKEAKSSLKKDKGASTGKTEPKNLSEELDDVEKPEKMQKGRTVTIDTSQSSSSTDIDDDSDVKPNRSESSRGLANRKNTSTEKTPKKSREKILKNKRTEASTSTTNLQDQKKSEKAASTQTDFDEQENVTFNEEQKPTTSDASFEIVDKRKKKDKKLSKEKVASGRPAEVDHSKDKPTGICESTQTDFVPTARVLDRVHVENDDISANRQTGETPTTTDSSVELDDRVDDKKKKKKKKSSKEKVASGASTSSVTDQPQNKPIVISESTQTDFEDQGASPNVTDRTQIEKFRIATTQTDSTLENEFVEIDRSNERKNSTEQQLVNNKQSYSAEEESKASVDQQSASQRKADTNELSNELSEKMGRKNKKLNKTNEKSITAYSSRSPAKFPDGSRQELSRDFGGESGRKSSYDRRLTNSSLELESKPIQTTENVAANATLIITGPAITEEDSGLDEERSFIIKPNVTMTDGSFVLTFKSCSCGEKAAAKGVPAIHQGRVNQGNAPLGNKGRNVRSISDVEMETLIDESSEPGTKKAASEMGSDTSPSGSTGVSQKSSLQKRSPSRDRSARKGSKDDTSEIDYLSSAYDKADSGEESKKEKGGGRGRPGVPLGGKPNKTEVSSTRREGVEETSRGRYQGQVTVTDSGGEKYRQQRRPCGEGGCRRRGGALYGVGTRDKRKKGGTAETKNEKDEGQPKDENEDKNAKAREDKTERKEKTKTKEESKDKLDEDKPTEEEKNQKDDQQNKKKKKKRKDKREDEPNDGDDKKETDKDVKKKKTRIKEESKEKITDDDEKTKAEREKKSKEDEEKKRKRYRRSSVESGASVRMVTAFNTHLATQALGRQKLAARKEASGTDRSFNTFWKGNLPITSKEQQERLSAPSKEPRSSIPCTSTATQFTLTATSPVTQSNLRATSKEPRVSLPAASITTECSLPAASTVCQPPRTSLEKAPIPSVISFQSSSNSIPCNNPSVNLSYENDLLSPNMSRQATLKAEPSMLDHINLQRNPYGAIERGACDHEPSSNRATLRQDSSHEADKKSIFMPAHNSITDCDSALVAPRCGKLKSNTSISETQRTDASEGSGKKRKRGQRNDHNTSFTEVGVDGSLIMTVFTGKTTSLPCDYDTASQKSYPKIIENLQGDRRLAQNINGSIFTKTNEKDLGPKQNANVLNEKHERHEISKESNQTLIPMVSGTDLPNKSKKPTATIPEVEKYETPAKTTPKVWVIDEGEIQPLCHPKVKRVESADSVISAQTTGRPKKIPQTQWSTSALVQHREAEDRSATDSASSRFSKGCRFSDSGTALKGSFDSDFTESAEAALDENQGSNDLLVKSHRFQNDVRRLIRVVQAQPDAAPTAENMSLDMSQSLKRTHRQSREDIFKIKSTESCTESRESQDDVHFSFSRYNNLAKSSESIVLQKDGDEKSRVADRVADETKNDSKMKKKESKWNPLLLLTQGRLKSRSKPIIMTQNSSQDELNTRLKVEDDQSAMAVYDFTDIMQPPSSSVAVKLLSPSAEVLRRAMR